MYIGTCIPYTHNTNAGVDRGGSVVLSAGWWYGTLLHAVLPLPCPKNQLLHFDAEPSKGESTHNWGEEGSLDTHIHHHMSAHHCRFRKGCGVEFGTRRRLAGRVGVDGEENMEGRGGQPFVEGRALLCLLNGAMGASVSHWRRGGALHLREPSPVGYLLEWAPPGAKTDESLPSAVGWKGPKMPKCSRSRLVQELQAAVFAGARTISKRREEIGELSKTSRDVFRRFELAAYQLPPNREPSLNPLTWDDNPEFSPCASPPRSTEKRQSITSPLSVFETAPPLARNVGRTPLNAQESHESSMQVASEGSPSTAR